MIQCHVVTTAEDFARCTTIRMEVFVREQLVPVEEELDDLDSISVHVLADVDGTPIGTGRLIPQGDGKGKISRMAVLSPHRGSVVFSSVLARLMDVESEQ
jgi:predicted GNAT family N-acyltransferase